MVTDPIFYRLFATSPETFFMLLGMANDQARETATHYEYAAIEFKETAHRSDGVFRPRESGLPISRCWMQGLSNATTSTSCRSCPVHPWACPFCT